MHQYYNYYSLLKNRPNGITKFYLAREVKVWHIVKDEIRSYKQKRLGQKNVDTIINRPSYSFEPVDC